MTHILHVTSMFLRVISDGECMVVKCGFEILLSARMCKQRGHSKISYDCCLLTEGGRSDRVDVLDA